MKKGDPSLAIPEGCEEPAQIVLDVAREIMSQWWKEEDEDVDTGGCTVFHHPEQWREDGNEYGIGRTSVLVVVHDGGEFADICDWSRQNYKWIDKMKDALEEKGYFMEQCTCWHSAVYHIKNDKPKEHWLKTWPKYFEDVRTGRKTFELRKNDRDFKVGDFLRLREWDPETKEYTGREVRTCVTYMLDGEAVNYALDEDYTVLGIEPIVNTHSQSEES